MEKNLFLEKWNKLTRQRITTKIKKVENKMNKARVVVQNDKKFDNSISLFHIKVVKREYNTRHEGIFFINPNRSFSPHHSFFFSYISFSILPFPIVIFPFLFFPIKSTTSFLIFILRWYDRESISLRQNRILRQFLSWEKIERKVKKYVIRLLK